MANVVVELMRRTKWSYMAYNLFHRKLLDHNTGIYKKIGLNKKYYSPIGSQDLLKYPVKEKPWLDVNNSAGELPSHPYFNLLDEKAKTGLLPWSEQGYAILEKFIPPSSVDDILEELDILVKQGKANWRYNNSKIMFAVWQSKRLRELASPPHLENILSMLLGKKVRLFQSINFYKGSQQAPHSDSIHMTTFPLGFMIAVWIALEDVTLASGPLSYYPGSHKMPYVLNKDIDNEGNKWLAGDKSYGVYENEIKQRIDNPQLEKRIFLAKKGDILIWHANLIHGGEPILQPELTRKSMVLHYFAEEVICYHELTQRPAFIRSA
jgi:ectoine hydroxylase